jgi:hypothetical protein
MTTMTAAAHGDIRSGLTYHGHAVLIAHIESERFLAGGGDKDPLHYFLRPNQLFAEACQECRQYLKHAPERFRPAFIPGGSPLDFDDFLYSPACFVALGDTDNIVMVAVDEFDLAGHLSSLVTVPTRQTCLAFCPELKSFRPALKRHRDTFCEFTDLYMDPFLSIRRNQDPDAVASCEHFLQQRPLLAVTYFKLNGMASLGPGLLIQEYTYKAMAQRICDTLDLLREHIDQYQETIPGGVADIDAFRCTFLDPQGWSDVATLMFSPNYTITATVIAALRCLTMQDLYKISEDSGEISLREAVACFDVHSRVARLSGTDADSTLSANHVFCSTYTSPGIYEKSFELDTVPPRGQAHHYNGLVIADSNLSVCAGHVLRVRRKAARQRDPGTCPDFPTTLQERYIWYMFGHNDFVYQQLGDGARDVGKVVEFASVIRQIKAMRGSTCDAEDGGTDADILDACTEVRIPIPILPRVMAETDYTAHADIKVVLETLRKSLFENNDGYLSINRLTDCMRIVRVPSPLSSAIRYLYADFANYLSDHFLFESVLDLFDAFVAFRTLLVEDLPDLLRRRLIAQMSDFPSTRRRDVPDSEYFADEQPNMRQALYGDTARREQLDSICLGFLSPEDLQDLVGIVELLQNALANRVQITFSAAERWNATVDARGIGLDRMMSAADAPLKCGLGMLRRVMNRLRKTTCETDHAEDIRRSNRRKIGGASSVSYHARCFSRRLVVGDTPDLFLASVDLNLSHLTRPQAFYIHLHETAHLVSQLLRDAQGCTHPAFGCAIADECCHKKRQFSSNELNEVYLERYQEIFAEMLIHKFVFHNDARLYFRNYIVNYSLDPICFGPDDHQSLIRMLEVFIRGFLASDPFVAPDVYSVNSDTVPVITDRIVNDAFRRFSTLLDDAGPFLHDFRRLWQANKRNEVWSYARKEFERVYRAAYHPVCCIWEDVREIYSLVAEETYPPGDAAANMVAKEIGRAISVGRPIVRVKYVSEESHDVPEAKRLGPLFIVSTLLREYISVLYADIDTASGVVYLPRGTNGKPDAECLWPSEGWNCAVLDRNFNGIVCASPQKRKESMQIRIAIIKTLWDISTTLRARRMKDMLSIVTNEP